MNPPTSQNESKDTFVAKGMVFTIGLFVVAVPILLGIIMVRSFFATDEEVPPKQPIPVVQAEEQNSTDTVR